MSYINGRQNAIVPASAVSDIPNSLLSKRQMKAMNSRNQVIQLAASNGAQQNAGGVVSFNIGCGAGQGYMRAGSAYLRFEFIPTAGAATDIFFNGTTASCSALFRTLNVNIGGLQVEQINDYNQYYRMIQAHATGAAYVERDCNITEQSPAMTSGTPRTFCVPILSGILNQENHIPLWLLSSQLQIQFNLASAPEAMGSATTAPTAFVIDNPTLVYEKIYTDSEFENAVRMKLQGGVYEIPFYSALAYRSNAGAGTFSQNIGVNLSSLSSVLHAHIASADVTSGSSRKLFISNNTNSRGGGSNRVIRCDGEQITQSQLYDPTQVFMELQRSVGCLLDTNQTSVATAATYLTDYFVNGQSTERFSDADLCMKGRSVNNVVVEEQGVVANSVVFMYLVYNAVLMISGDGSSLISK